MKRFLTLLVLGVLVTLTLALANVPQAAAYTNSSVATFSCDNTGDTRNPGTLATTGPAIPVTLAAETSCVNSDKILTDAHFRLKALVFTAPNVYELWIKGGGDD